MQEIEKSEGPVCTCAILRSLRPSSRDLIGSPTCTRLQNVVDKHEECETWGAEGECITNPLSMLTWCAETCTRVAEFCEARRAEGNLAYAASLDPDNRFPFDEAISAEELYISQAERTDVGGRSELRRRVHRARRWRARGRCAPLRLP